MKRQLFIVGAILFPLLLPVSAAAKIGSGVAAKASRTSSQVVWPSRRAIRENVRAGNVLNSRMIGISDVALDATFVSKDPDVKIQYPSSWQRSDVYEQKGPLDFIAAFLSPTPSKPGIRQNINLVVETLPSDMTLDEYSTQGLDVERGYFRDYTLLTSVNTLVAGTWRAHRAVFVATADAGQMKFEQLWILRGKTVHVWTFADALETFDTHVKTFERMIDTLVMR